MTLDEFDHLLDRCGGEAEGWPAGAESAARRLLAQSSQARVALNRAQVLDRLIAGTRVTGESAGGADRATERRQARAPTRLALGARAAGFAAAGAVTLSLGLAIGSRERGASLSPDQAAAVALGAPTEPGDAG